MMWDRCVEELLRGREINRPKNISKSNPREQVNNHPNWSSARGIRPIESSIGLKVCAKPAWGFRQLRKKIRSKLSAALSPSPSPCAVTGIKPETSTLYFPWSGAVQF